MVRILKINQFIKNQLRRLRDIRDAPEAVAGGVAIGMFLGFSPLFGIKTLLAIGLAWLFRCSKLAAAIAVTLHDILLPVAPFVLRMEYDIGYWLLSSPHRWPERIHLEKLVMAEWFHWSRFFESGSNFFEACKPLILGSVIVGATSAVLSYFATHALLRHWAETHHLHQPQADE